MIKNEEKSFMIKSNKSEINKLKAEMGRVKKEKLGLEQKLMSYNKERKSKSTSSLKPELQHNDSSIEHENKTKCGCLKQNNHLGLTGHEAIPSLVSHYNWSFIHNSTSHSLSSHYVANSMGIDYSTSDNDSDEELEISDETEALVYEYLKKWEKQLDSMGSVLDNMNRS